MPALTRRRNPDARQESWLVYYGEVRVGTIAIRSGDPFGTEAGLKGEGQMNGWKWLGDSRDQICIIAAPTASMSLCRMLAAAVPFEGDAGPVGFGDGALIVRVVTLENAGDDFQLSAIWTGRSLRSC